MTRNGIIARLYSTKVEPRPFSRFTGNPDEKRANQAWRGRAEEWGKTHVDEWGHCKHVDFSDTLDGGICDTCGVEMTVGEAA